MFLVVEGQTYPVLTSFESIWPKIMKKYWWLHQVTWGHFTVIHNINCKKWATKHMFVQMCVRCSISNDPSGLTLSVKCYLCNHKHYKLFHILLFLLFLSWVFSLYTDPKVLSATASFSSDNKFWKDSKCYIISFS